MNPQFENSASTIKEKPPLAGRAIKIGAQPIIWSNDDFQELGGDISLETCLQEMKESGYAGTELGHKFPKEPEALKRVLENFGLELVSGWHCTYLSAESFEKESERFSAHLALLKALGSGTAIVAECAGRNFNKRGVPVEQPALSDEDWKTLSSGLDRLAAQAADSGITVAYHHHMGTVIQNEDAIDRLMESTRTLGLLVDTGHLSFAGIDPSALISKYKDRLAHVHLKDLRPEVLGAEDLSFEKAVKQGVFTVPGDGAVDFKLVFSVLAEAEYEGWMVVEAEQDPAKANPLEYAKKGRAFIKENAGV